LLASHRALHKGPFLRKVYDEGVFALGIPVIGGLVGVGGMTICLIFPGLRRFALAALVSAFAASVVFFFGTLIVADINLAAEHGSGFTLKGYEHGPTTLGIWLYFGSPIVTFLLSVPLLMKVQQFTGRFFLPTRSFPKRQPDVP
jgi:hypothetical protein